MIIKLQLRGLFMGLFLATLGSAFRVWQPQPTILTFPITYQGKLHITQSKPRCKYFPCDEAPQIGWTPDGGWYMLVLPLTYSAGKFNYSFQMEMYIRILGPIDVLEDQQEEVEQQHVSSNSGSSSTYSSFSSPYTNYYYDTK